MGVALRVATLTWAGDGSPCVVSVRDEVREVTDEDRAVWVNANAVVVSRTTGLRVFVRETVDQARAAIAAASQE